MSIHRRLVKLYFICTMNYCSAIKMNEEREMDKMKEQ